MLTLATHNLYKGGPQDYSAWARALGELSPDVLLLQESSEPCMYRNKLTPEQREHVDDKLWSRAKTNYWGSAIYLAKGTATRLSLSAELDGWVVAADVQGLPWQPGAGRPLRIVSLHTPTDKASTYEIELDAALDEIARLTVGHDLIIGGDFNVTISARHVLEERRNTPGEKYIHQRLRNEFGLINCWQACHPGERLMQTHRHMFSNEPQAFHLDGLFVPESWRPFLRTCEVRNDTAWRGEGCSDHFPVVATFAA